MVKTVFYIPTTGDEKSDRYFVNKPFKEFFAVDVLYDTKTANDIPKYIVDEQDSKKLIIEYVKDEFSESGIVRRVALGILDYL